MWQSRGAAVVDTWLAMENYCHITQSHQLPWLIDNMHYILYVHLGDGQPTMYIWLIYCSSQLHKQCIVYIHSKLCPLSNMHEIKNDMALYTGALWPYPLQYVYTHNYIVYTHSYIACWHSMWGTFTSPQHACRLTVFTHRHAPNYMQTCTICVYIQYHAYIYMPVSCTSCRLIRSWSQ